MAILIRTSAILASRWLSPRTAICKRNNAAGLRVVEGRVEQLLAARLTCLSSWALTHLLHTLRIHDQAVEDHIGRRSLSGRVNSQLEVFGVLQTRLARHLVGQVGGYAILLERKLSLQLILAAVHTRPTLPAQLCPLVKATKPCSRLANIRLIDSHRVIYAVLFGASVGFTPMARHSCC